MATEVPCCTKWAVQLRGALPSGLAFPSTNPVSCGKAPEARQLSVRRRTRVLLKEPPLALETRARNPIDNAMKPERPKVALEASAALFKKLFPDAQLRSLTALYNCIGLIVASRRAWVDPSDLIRVLREDGYRKLTSAQEAEMGDVVIYRNQRGEVCHAGIVLRKNLLSGQEDDLLTVLSKGGADGEYIHGLSKLPAYLGTPTQFWTDRRGT
jgi:hypothetical protein